jgi:H+/Cl- antiporter ClcA
VEFLRIVLLSVLAAVVYGILHDQVTARVCVEYFTVGHPPIFHTQSPTLLGLAWGILATWWVGLFLGIPLAGCARAGSSPRLAAKDLIRPIALLLAFMAALALIAGVSGFLVVKASGFHLDYVAAASLPVAKQQFFIACWFAHLASYGSGFLGGLLLCLWAVLRRRRMDAGPGIPRAGTRPTTQ